MIFTKSLATTGRYLAIPKRPENRHGEQLAALFGIEYVPTKE